MASPRYTPPKDRMASFVEGKKFTVRLFKTGSGLLEEQQTKMVNKLLNNETYPLPSAVQA